MEDDPDDLDEDPDHLEDDPDDLDDLDLLATCDPGCLLARVRLRVMAVHSRSCFPRWSTAGARSSKRSLTKQRI